MADERVPALKLTLFGTMQVEVNGVSLAGKCAKKEMWLLALLALRLGKAVTREYLAGLLWPDASEEQMLYYLRRSLSNIRTSLGEAGDCLQIVKPRSLCLDATQVSVDVHHFDRLVAQEEGSAQERAVTLRSAPLLEDCVEEWAHQERQVREAAYSRALHRLAELAAARFAWQEAARCAQLLIATDALDEKAARTLMLALARTGNHGAAMQAYRDVRLRLREEVNAEPDPETLALYEILRLEARQSAKEQARAVPVQTTVVPVETVRPQRIGQSLTRLIGRESERGEILSLLSTARLVTLTGTGGIGKTTLSLEVARQAESRFAQGACLVELAPLSDPERLPDTIAQALKIPDEPGVSALDKLTQTLAERELLLVLDNCEHLLEGCARLVSRLLTYCPALKILASSRQSLGLNGEIVWRVPSLRTPPDLTALSEAKGDTSYLLEFPSVQLFLERIKQSNPDFRITPQTLPVIGQICRQLDGIPLALELAAGRARVLPLTHIAARLDDRLRLLVGGSRAALPRQQTLRALIDWSYDLLTEPERLLLRCLSVFANGWTLEAAESLFSQASSGDEKREPTASLPLIEDWEALDLLMALVEKSLVIYEEVDGAPRYRFLETVRQYGQGLLQPSEEKIIREKVIDHYFRFLMALKPTLFGPRQAENLRAIDLEHDNIVRVLDFAASSKEHRQKALEMASVLYHYWRVRGHLKQGRAMLQTLLECAPEPTAARAAALHGACTLTYVQGEYEEAQAYGYEALAIRRALNSTEGVAPSLGNLANIANYLGQYETAIKLNEEALALYTQSQEKRNIAITLNGLGSIWINLGDLDRAQRYFEESLALRREIKDSLGVATTMTYLCDVAFARNDLVTLEALVSECGKIYTAFAEKRGNAIVWDWKGQIAARRGEYRQAMNLYREALNIYRDIGDKRGYFHFLDHAFNLALAQEQYERAARLNGALEAQRKAIHYAFSPQMAEAREVIARQIQDAIGANTYLNLFQAGSMLSLEDALSLGENG